MSLMPLVKQSLSTKFIQTPNLLSNSVYFPQDVIWIFLNSLPLGMFDEGQIQGAAKSNEEMNISDVMLTSFEQLPRSVKRKLG